MSALKVEKVSPKFSVGVDGRLYIDLGLEISLDLSAELSVDHEKTLADVLNTVITLGLGKLLPPQSSSPGSGV